MPIEEQFLLEWHFLLEEHLTATKAFSSEEHGYGVLSCYGSTNMLLLKERLIAQELLLRK